MSSLEELKFLNSEPDLNYFCDLSTNITCRICLERFQNKKMCHIFESTEPLSDMIMSCAVVQILQGDGLPNGICQKCLAMLNVAYQFKLQCEGSDLKLRQFYINPNVQLVQESEPFAQSDKNEKVLQLDEESIDLPQPNEFLNEEPKISANNDTKPKSKSKTLKTTRPKESKVHQCDTCGKVFNRREYLTQHIRIHTGEKPYCCHICEKRFINSGHLTTHMRTHTGERPHVCSQCPKAFSTRQELNKHTMVHNGERPFVCTTCGKSFGSSSNLYSHLRHHTGEKNFTCEHCGKAFYTKQELKQHLVVHTGEKAFVCEFCNKRFSQSAHLRRHLKLHG